MTGRTSVLAALGAALLFGASTPFAKQHLIYSLFPRQRESSP